MNLEIVAVKRGRPKAGDVFRMRMPGVGFLFGRVVDTEAVGGGFPGVLVYIYDHVSRTPLPQAWSLSPDRLLVEPLVTNRLPWSRGYFESFESRALETADLRPRHCFCDPLERHGRRTFYDEKGREVPGGSEPCGLYVLHSFRTIDDAVSEALGIPVSDGP